jgi:hypothetical protein
MANRLFQDIPLNVRALLLLAPEYQIYASGSGERYTRHLFLTGNSVFHCATGGPFYAAVTQYLLKFLEERYLSKIVTCLLEEYSIRLAETDSIVLEPRPDGFVNLRIVVFDTVYCMPVGLSQTSPSGLVDFRIFNGKVGLARTIVGCIDPRRSISAHWKYEDWDTLEAEEEG